jgi:hypothetical protein
MMQAIDTAHMQHSDHVITDQRTFICAWREASPAPQDQPRQWPGLDNLGAGTSSVLSPFKIDGMNSMFIPFI